MKNSVLLALFALVVCMGCSKDDDPNSKSGCESCTAKGEKAEICLSKSGTLENTYTVVVGDEQQTITQTNLDDLGMTPKEYVQNICDLANQN